MTQPESVSGRQLLALLPEVYRTRDKRGDLADYLDASGELLDLFRNTLDQFLADAFPDRPASGSAAQEWILPYLAQLLDVRLVSPHVDGRHQEVAQAVVWRQRKGTLKAVEEIAEAVGQLEVEVQEGWRRVAVTPRVDVPIVPAAAFGVTEPDQDNPLAAARHPGLPSIMPDLTRTARAVRASAEEAGARATRFAGDTLYWRQVNPHGVPCFPGSFDDPSHRTPDMRTPDWRQGHAHPRRALLLVPPPMGFFPVAGHVTLKWSERNLEDHEDHVADVTEGAERLIYNPSHLPDASTGPVAVTITTKPPVFEETRVFISNLNFDSTVTVNGGRVELNGVAAKKVVVTTAGVDQPVLVAVDCLFETIEAVDGLVRLEYTTVTGALSCRRLEASDVILAGSVTLTGSASDRRASCVRYSRIPENLAAVLTTDRRPESTTDRPVFQDFETCDALGGGLAHHSVEFGQPGHGVLHPATAASICFGAEDGGEMGAYHRRRHCLSAAAVLVKLESFLPVGIEAALVPDARLLTAPPEETP